MAAPYLSGSSLKGEWQTPYYKQVPPTIPSCMRCNVRTTKDVKVSCCNMVIILFLRTKDLRACIDFPVSYRQWGPTIAAQT